MGQSPILSGGSERRALAGQGPFPPAREDGFLLALGRRVREIRSRRGMTRKVVAREADVSERHLAQLESGEGNISVVLLRRIAAALNVFVAEVFTREQELSTDEKLLTQFFEKLPPHRVQQVLSRLQRELETEEKSRRTRIALIGLRGAGKSTLGAKLAKELKLEFIELDREVEKEAGMPLSEIFSLYGQSGYRRIEKRALESVLQKFERAVISV